jgi:hypothetical protein
MLVLACTGLKVPLEEKPRQYITDTAPEGQSGFEVPESAYYLRRLAEGDLVRVAADASSKKPKAASPDVAPVTA